MAKEMKISNTVAIVLASLVVLAGLFVASIFTVQYGTVSVITRFGKIEGDVLQPGLHYKIPIIDSIITYRTQKIVYETQNITPYSGSSSADYQDYAVDTTTQDGQQVSITYTVRFSINPDEIKEIAYTLGTEEEVVEKIVKAETRIKARSVPRNFKAFDLYTGNIDTVASQIADELSPVFHENGLILDEFGIREITFDENYVSTIEEKQIEREKVETEKYRAEQEEFRKETAITKAEGEAEAQKLLQSSITKELLQKLYIEKWDGILPEVMPGDSSSLLLDINK